MKNIIILLILASSQLSSQLSIPNSHLPRIGDTFVFAVDTSLYTPKPLANGVFDFSDLKLNDTTHFYYLKNDSIATYPSSNLKLKIDTSVQSTIYFNRTANDLLVIALSNLTNIPLPIPSVPKLQGTLKYLSFPINSSTNLTTTDKIDITIPSSFIPPQLNIDSILSTILPGSTITLDSLVLSLNLSLNLKTDGQGKIKTPKDNNLDVIKLVRKISISPKIFLNGTATISGGFKIPIKNQDITSLLLGAVPFQIPDIITHTYYSPSSRQEIVNAVVDSNGKYQAVNYRFRTKDGGFSSSILESASKEINVQITDTKLKVLSLPSNAEFQITIYNLQGQVLINSTINSIQNSIDWNPQNQPFIVQINGNNLYWNRLHKK